MAKWICSVCGYEYDEKTGDPENHISPGTLFKSFTDHWACPLCGRSRRFFTPVSD